MGAIGMPELLIVLLVGIVLALAALIPYWKIFGKAGFSPWLALLMIVPVANIIVLWILAFSRWNPPPAALEEFPPGRR